jgi:hypothetical protein
MCRLGDLLDPTTDRKCAAARADAADVLNSNASRTALFAAMTQLRSMARRRRRRSKTEAELRLTRAYVELVLAWGAARLGFGDEARAWLAAAPAALPAGDPVHRTLVRLFGFRVRQALVRWRRCPTERRFAAMVASGDPVAPVVYSDWLEEQDDLDRAEWVRGRMPDRTAASDDVLAWGMATRTRCGLPEGAPGGLNALIDAMPKATRYKIDRVREVSEILEPYAHRDPLAEFYVDRPDATPAHAPAARLFRRYLAGWPLATFRVQQALRVVVEEPGIDDARLRLCLRRLADCVPTAPPPPGLIRLVELAADLAPDAPERVTLADALEAPSGPRTPWHLARELYAQTLRPRADFNTDDAVSEVIVWSHGAPRAAVQHPLRACVAVLRRAPLPDALRGLERLRELFPAITDAFSTNTHLSIAVLAFVETLALGYARHADGGAEPL